MPKSMLPKEIDRRAQEARRRRRARPGARWRTRVRELPRREGRRSARSATSGATLAVILGSVAKPVAQRGGQAARRARPRPGRARLRRRHAPRPRAPQRHDAPGRPGLRPALARVKRFGANRRGCGRIGGSHGSTTRDRGRLTRLLGDGHARPPRGRARDQGRGRPQGLRRRQGGRWRQLRGGEGRDLRPPRPERRRQDDDDGDARGPPPAGRRGSSRCWAWTSGGSPRRSRTGSASSSRPRRCTRS